MKIKYTFLFVSFLMSNFSGFLYSNKSAIIDWSRNPYSRCVPQPKLDGKFSDSKHEPVFSQAVTKLSAAFEGVLLGAVAFIGACEGLEYFGPHKFKKIRAVDSVEGRALGFTAAGLAALIGSKIFYDLFYLASPEAFFDSSQKNFVELTQGVYALDYSSVSTSEEACELIASMAYKSGFPLIESHNLLVNIAEQCELNIKNLEKVLKIENTDNNYAAIAWIKTALRSNDLEERVGALLCKFRDLKSKIVHVISLLRDHKDYQWQLSEFSKHNQK